MSGKKKEEKTGLQGFLEDQVPKLPEKVQPYAKQAIPILVQIAAFFDKAWPVIKKYFEIVKQKWIKYNLEELVPFFFGLICAFLGGYYMATIAALEAFRTFGWKAISPHVKVLMEDGKKVAEALKKDHKKDDNQDNIPDVQQLKPAEYLVRHLDLLARTVEPDRVSSAFSGLLSGTVSVVAALKLKFAKAVTLGNALAEVVQVSLRKHVVPPLKAVVPEDYKKWVEPVLLFIVRVVVMNIAFFFHRVVSAFHSAFRGGTLAARNLLPFLKKKYPHAPLVKDYEEETSWLDEGLGYTLAVLGLLFQWNMVSSGMPWLLWLIFFPLNILESILMYVVAYA
uniref:Uncharacterized protein n=1 Tax=Chromera velia CCMP2878 TaxID=1169474 RepID=A0A0G4G8V7_9ALVE|mmetsp:Transcript_24312/g.47728  ORF Transcript_24312/g.47728 Transcript_24312/m.47728 type:complete len:338 (-) Transcript_24312:541-1554(-)|eukprot:Cvel_4367.t1-p1 / transcript=Cvel_4367.t1 / gene=Cvel_4367 / organism=Chromera_velia_CCMP2878 / gene_product=hypothetical protein / transcript_product=hypothetical protein / location=Cvel_scaffold189:60602-64335(+) / protein_length=337 / sequence_SO=supercontig / SO=protein_coding / is_pseudo=false